MQIKVIIFLSSLPAVSAVSAEKSPTGVGNFYLRAAGSRTVSGGCAGDDAVRECQESATIPIDSDAHLILIPAECSFAGSCFCLLKPGQKALRTSLAMFALGLVDRSDFIPLLSFPGICQLITLSPDSKFVLNRF